jgi:hypothetical protein
MPPCLPPPRLLFGAPGPQPCGPPCPPSVHELIAALAHVHVYVYVYVAPRRGQGTPRGDLSWVPCPPWACDLWRSCWRCRRWQPLKPAGRQMLLPLLLWERRTEAGSVSRLWMSGYATPWMAFRGRGSCHVLLILMITTPPANSHITHTEWVAWHAEATCEGKGKGHSPAERMRTQICLVGTCSCASSTQRAVGRRLRVAHPPTPRW